jgi:hypothetical protein
LPHDLLNEYNDMPVSAFRGVEVPATITEEPATSSPRLSNSTPNSSTASLSASGATKKVKRTPKDIYRPSETTPLFEGGHDSITNEAGEDGGKAPYDIPWLEDDDVDSSDRIVTIAIYVNFAANAILLAGKIAVVISVPSVSVLASLVDAVLDFLSTAIVWTTTWLIARQDHYSYPVGRRR